MPHLPALIFACHIPASPWRLSACRAEYPPVFYRPRHLLHCFIWELLPQSTHDPGRMPCSGIRPQISRPVVLTAPVQGIINNGEKHPGSASQT